MHPGAGRGRKTLVPSSPQVGEQEEDAGSPQVGEQEEDAGSLQVGGRRRKTLVPSSPQVGEQEEDAGFLLLPRPAAAHPSVHNGRSHTLFLNLLEGI